MSLFGCVDFVKADASAHIGGHGDARMNMSIIKEHFPGYLLKVLYSSKAYSCLAQFAQIFDDLVGVGCKAPCDLHSLRAFAEADLLGATVPAVAGDLSQRLLFFSSPLYKHFLELRVSALESAAKSASENEKRDAFLKALYSAAESLEDPSSAALKSAMWARSMLTSSAPLVARVTFALEADSPQRVAYSATFGDGQVGGVSWRCLQCFVDTVDIPVTIGWNEFDETVRLVAAAGLRKQVVNPLIGAFMDFHSEVRTQFGGHMTWVPGLLETAARAKLGARHWQDVALSAEIFAEGDLVPLSRTLGKLFPFRAPEWVIGVREKAAEIRLQLRRAAEESAAGSPVAAVAPGAAGKSAEVALGARAGAAEETATASPASMANPFVMEEESDGEGKLPPVAIAKREAPRPTRGIFSQDPFTMHIQHDPNI